MNQVGFLDSECMSVGRTGAASNSNLSSSGEGEAPDKMAETKRPGRRAVLPSFLPPWIPTARSVGVGQCTDSASVHVRYVYGTYCCKASKRPYSINFLFSSFTIFLGNYTMYFKVARAYVYYTPNLPQFLVPFLPVPCKAANPDPIEELLLLLCRSIKSLSLVLLNVAYLYHSPALHPNILSFSFPPLPSLRRIPLAAWPLPLSTFLGDSLKRANLLFWPDAAASSSTSVRPPGPRGQCVTYVLMRLLHSPVLLVLRRLPDLGVDPAKLTDRRSIASRVSKGVQNRVVSSYCYLWLSL